MNPDTIIQYTTAAGLCLILTISFLLGRWKALAWLSPPLIALGLTAILVNLKVMPGQDNNAIYDFVSGPGLFAAVFLLLLQIDLGVFKRAGPHMLILFGVGAAAVSIGIAGTLFIPWIGDTLGAAYPKLSGMYAATYIGGSMNFNATAAALGMERNSDVFAVAVAVDSLMGSSWIALSILCAPLLRRFFPHTQTLNQDKAAGRVESIKAIEPADYVIGGAAASASVLLALWLGSQFPGWHPILWLTGIALIAAQTPLGDIGRKLEPVAIVLLYLFIAAIGAGVSFQAIADSGPLALACITLVGICFICHGVAIFGVGKAIKADSDVILVASQAAIGGPPTVLAVADAIGRKDLRIPGVAAGLIGYAIGTYVGISLHAFITAMIATP
jgi:uncharacterized membrane protein